MRLFIFTLAYVSAFHVVAQHWASKCAGIGNERVADVKAGPGDVLFSIGEFGPGSDILGQGLVPQGLFDVFVVKQDASGAVQWAAQAGGPGLDLAGKVCPAPDGSVVVCGQFTGTATLFGTSITAQGGSTDLFVAKLSSTGALIWLRTGGSPAYTDRATGVAVGDDGRVVVTGEFRGTAVFDAGTFTSTIDPGTSLPSSDVFVMSYSADGTAEWFKQGVAERDDQAADVVMDATGSCYAYGLYSETLSFGTPHPNSALNQIFLVRFDAAGTEQWFRRIGDAALQQPVDMQLGDAGWIYLCGDVQGTLTFVDGSPNTVPSTNPNACFLLRCTTDGEFASGIAVGSVNGVRAAGVYQHGSVAGVFGEFNCAFGDLQAHYSATGIFIATGQEDLFITEHDATSCVLTEAQQLGGHLEKSAGGITTLGNGDLVFCGAFSELLIFPSEGDGWGEDFGACPPAALGTAIYCGDAHYTGYEALESTGALDGFIARGYVDSREPYDPFSRTGNTCLRSFQDLIITSWPGVVTDLAVKCADDTLSWVNTIHRPSCPTCQCPTSMSVSWDVTDLWSTGEDYFDTVIVSTTGWYSRTHTASNGCYSATDSIHLTVLDAPDAWVSADGAPPVSGVPQYISSCGPPVELVAVNLLSGETAQWTMDGVPLSGDTVFAEESALFVLTVTGQNGCVASTSVYFTMLPSVTIPNITSAEFVFYYNGVPLDELDTIQACSETTYQQGYILATWYVDGVPTVLSQPYIVFAETSQGGGTASYADQAIAWYAGPASEGWYPLDVQMMMNVEGCDADTMSFSALDSVYLATGNAPVVAPINDVSICPGDTAMVVLDCQGCTEVEWTGPGTIITSAGEDTAWVSTIGLYSVITTNTDGVFCKTVEYFVLSLAAPPPLVISPYAVCPGESAILSTPFVSDLYEWSGPSGPIPDNNDSLSISEIGSYYLTAYTAEGCALFAGPAVLQQFALPVMNALPSTILCSGGSVDLVVSGGGLEQIWWDPPLSGNGLTQSITEAGTYSCSVVACGDTFDLSVEVVASSIDAELPSGPFALCGGSTVLLDGPSGDYSYLWTPGNETTEDLLVSTAGTYQLQVSDASGCQAFSDPVLVTVQDFADPLQVEGDSLCEGDDLLLTATGSGLLSWYDDAALTQALGTGGTLNGGAQTVTDTLYVTQTEGDCTGPVTAVIVIVTPGPGPLIITGDTELCEGDPLSLSAGAVDGSDYLWTTPQGTIAGEVVTLPAVSVANSGTYACVADNNGCGESGHDVVVTVQANLAPLAITGATALCEGDLLVLNVAEVVSGDVTWSVPAGMPPGSGPVYTSIATMASSGTYTVIADGGECPNVSAAVEVSIEACDLIVPNVFTPNNDGANDLFIIEGTAAGVLGFRVFNRWGQEVYSTVAASIAWNGRTEGNDLLPDGVYFYELVEDRAGNSSVRTGYIQLSRGK